MNNYETKNRISISNYKTIIIPNFFVFDLQHKYSNLNLRIDVGYLTEIAKFEDYLIILGFNTNTIDFVVNLYCTKENKIKFKQNLPLYSRIGYNYFNNSPSYTSFIKNKNVLSIMFEGSQMVYFELLINNGILILNEIKSEDLNIPSELNYVSCDDFKFAFACGDNTIKVFSSKYRKLWYTLLSGSLTVMPKSFVADTNIRGFSKVLVTKTSIIASIGNMIRQYDFNSKFK